MLLPTPLEYVRYQIKPEKVAFEAHVLSMASSRVANLQAIAKLKRQAKRAKEVLSANSFAPISVEELMSGHDFRSRIER